MHAKKEARECSSQQINKWVHLKRVAREKKLKKKEQRIARAKKKKKQCPPLKTNKNAVYPFRRAQKFSAKKKENNTHKQQQKQTQK